MLLGKRSLLFVLLFSLTLTVSAAQGTGRASHSSKSSTGSKAKSSARPKAKSADKPVHVREYKRKDGTVVHPHDRSLPGTKTKSISTTKTTVTTSQSSSGIPKSSTVAASNTNGKIARSAKAKDDFMKQSGYPKGRPGYVVDHVVPLECGGADAPSNMQWQTTFDTIIPLHDDLGIRSRQSQCQTGCAILQLDMGQTPLNRDRKVFFMP